MGESPDMPTWQLEECLVTHRQDMLGAEADRPPPWAQAHIVPSRLPCQGSLLGPWEEPPGLLLSSLGAPPAQRQLSLTLCPGSSALGHMHKLEQACLGSKDLG